MSHEKPEIDFPDSPPPTDLEITDVTTGEGAEAVAGKTVHVHYVGVAHSTGAPPTTSSAPSCRPISM